MSSAGHPALAAARLLVQGLLSKAVNQGGHLEELVFLDVLQGLFDGHAPGRLQDDVLVGTGRPDVGEPLRAAGVDRDIVFLAVLAHDHPLVNLVPRLDEHGTSIAEADGGGDHNGCARIDYTGGLAPGTYYVRVRGQKSTTDGFYAVRLLLTQPEIDYSAWYFGVTGDDASYEPDDDPPSGGVPTDPVPITVGGKLNRALTDGDVDWLVFTLP